MTFNVGQDTLTKPLISAVRIIGFHLVAVVHILLHPRMALDLGPEQGLEDLRVWWITTLQEQIAPAHDEAL